MRIITKTKRELILLIVFIVGLFLRILKLAIDPLLLRDSVFYLNQAEAWSESGKYQAIIQDGNGITPPLPIYLIKEIMAWGYNAEIAGRSISMFLGSMVPVLGYVIAIKVFKDVWTALLCAFLLCLHPSLVSISTQPIRENQYLFCIGVVAICLIDGIIQQRLRYFFWGGVFLSIAIYSRYEALEMLIIVPLIVLFLALRKIMPARYLYSCLTMFYVSCFLSCCILLSIVDFDMSFITKLAFYKDSLVQKNDFENLIYNNPEVSQ